MTHAINQVGVDFPLESCGWCQRVVRILQRGCGPLCSHWLSVRGRLSADCGESPGQQDEIGAPPAVGWRGPNLAWTVQIMNLAG